MVVLNQNFLILDCPFYLLCKYHRKKKSFIMLSIVMENKNKSFTNISIFNLKSWSQNLFLFAVCKCHRKKERSFIMLNTVMENKNKCFTNISIFNLKSSLQIMINYEHDLRRYYYYFYFCFPLWVIKTMKLLTKLQLKEGKLSTKESFNVNG